MLTPEEWLKESFSEEKGYRMASGWRYAYEYPVQPWKLHVYAYSAEDWMQTGQIILPYLHLYGISHKTVADLYMLDRVTADPWQRGKLYTIYAETVQILKQIIFDLDRLLEQAGAKPKESAQIFGDQPIGYSGRLFYRYDRDEWGSYRPNDGTYMPKKLRDPFSSFSIEYKLAMLGLGRNFVIRSNEIAQPLAEVSPLKVETDGEKYYQIQLLTNEPEIVFLNGQPLPRSCIAKPGDTIWIMPDTEIMLLQYRQPN
jgi:hypothetical protein